MLQRKERTSSTPKTVPRIAQQPSGGLSGYGSGSLSGYARAPRAKQSFLTHLPDMLVGTSVSVSGSVLV